MPLRPSESPSGFNFSTERFSTRAVVSAQLQPGAISRDQLTGLRPGGSYSSHAAAALAIHGSKSFFSLSKGGVRRKKKKKTSIFTNWASMLLSVTFTTTLSKSPRPQILQYWLKEIGLHKVGGERQVPVAAIRRLRDRPRKSEFWKATWLIRSRPSSPPRLRLQTGLEWIPTSLACEAERTKEIRSPGSLKY